MRQIIIREPEFSAQLRVKIFECASQLTFDPFSRFALLEIQKVRDRVAEHDPDRRTPQRQPPFFGIESVAAEDYARQDWNLSDVGKCRCAGSERRAFQQRTRAMANTTLWKQSNDVPTLKPIDRGADCLAIRVVSISWKSIHGMQKKSEHGKSKEFRHRHPIDLPSHYRRNDKRIEMADMICRQQKSAWAIRILTSDHVDAGRIPEQQLH